MFAILQYRAENSGKKLKRIFDQFKRIKKHKVKNKFIQFFIKYLIFDSIEYTTKYFSIKLAFKKIGPKTREFLAFPQKT